MPAGCLCGADNRAVPYVMPVPPRPGPPQERLAAGKGLPQYAKDHIIYYAGPAKTPEGYASGSFGPTTAGEERAPGASWHTGCRSSTNAWRSHVVCHALRHSYSRATLTPPPPSGRMDSYVDEFMAAGGSLVTLAKGNRSRAVTQACKKHRGFYLGSIGGCSGMVLRWGWRRDGGGTE